MSGNDGFSILLQGALFIFIIYCMVKDSGWKRNFTVIYALISGYFLYDFSSNDADESLVIVGLMWLFYVPIVAILVLIFESDESK